MSAGAAAALAGLGSSAIGLGNGSNGYGYGQGENFGYGTGNGYNYGGSSGSANSWSNNHGTSVSNNSGYNISSSYSRTYGSEATAKDIQNAELANRIARENWERNAQYNAEQAEINRDFQEYMSNTAYQRAVIDLLKAGINPILAVANMGASTPVGATASSAQSESYKANAYADQVSHSYSYGSNQGSSKSYQTGNSGSSSQQTSSWGGRNKYSNQTYGYNYNMYETTNNISKVADKAMNTAQSAITKIGNIITGMTTGRYTASRKV